VLAVLTLASPAFGGLGGDVASVEADLDSIGGTLRVTSAAAYTIEEIQAASGTVVREYLSPGGTVFAVAWQGPWLPDLRQLLGEYFEPFTQAAGRRRVGRGPLRLEMPEFVLQSGGHQRAFFGRAYLPQRLPQGFRVDEIR
jgi:hypothetical protein